RLSIVHVLDEERHWTHGRKYTNQYTLIWSATAAFLELFPDPEIESKMIQRFLQSKQEFISPAGFYYEEDGYDMSYNLGVHLQNLMGDYHYFKDTPLEQALIEKESLFFDWLSYNLVMEPDGSYFSANSGPS